MYLMLRSKLLVPNGWHRANNAVHIGGGTRQSMADHFASADAMQIVDVCKARLLGIENSHP